jgi:hypothetical protein
MIRILPDLSLFDVKAPFSMVHGRHSNANIPRKTTVITSVSSMQHLIFLIRSLSVFAV